MGLAAAYEFKDLRYVLKSRCNSGVAVSGTTIDGADQPLTAQMSDSATGGSGGDTLKQVEEEYRAQVAGLRVKDVGRTARCADRPGLVAAVSAFLAGAGANIVSLDQHSTEQSGGTFMQRTIFNLPGLTAARDALERDFRAQVASRFDMDFRLTEAAKPKRVAIMASKEDHCLLDLLWRNRRGELDISVVMVISNHPDLADQVRPFSVPFLHVPATKDIRVDAERRQLDLLRGNVDLVVLARYMQILTPQFLAEVDCPLINIHHSFLPAFIGAAPYRRAKERGVKLVGATAHYVTEDLDDGPIIEQDVVRVDHRHGVDDLIRLGADVERLVLSRAVLWHCEDRIIRYGNQTVVF
jgi:formyltetrahydrofolate deformylase